MSSKPKSCIEILFDFLKESGTQNLEWIDEGDDKLHHFQYQIFAYRNQIFTHRVSHEHNDKLTFTCDWGFSLPPTSCAANVMMQYLLMSNQIGLYKYTFHGSHVFLTRQHSLLQDCSDKIVSQFLSCENELLDRITKYQQELEHIGSLIRDNCD